jgi:hypothetical protein
MPTIPSPSTLPATSTRTSLNMVIESDLLLGVFKFIERPAQCIIHAADFVITSLLDLITKKKGLSSRQVVPQIAEFLKFVWFYRRGTELVARCLKVANPVREIMHAQSASCYKLRGLVYYCV